MKTPKAAADGYDFHDSTREVHVDFNIGNFLDVKVDKDRGVITVTARAVGGPVFNVDYRTSLANVVGVDAAERLMEDAAHALMKATILEQMKR